MGYRIAVVGATGNVGHEMLNILAERAFPVDEIVALASRKSLGTEVSFGDKTLKTKDLDSFDFTGWDIALFAVGSEATKLYAPKAAASGCVVIDNSSLYRYDPDIPLIVPEVNAEAIVDYSKKNILANPTRFGFFDAIHRMGGDIECLSRWKESGEKVKNIKIEYKLREQAFHDIKIFKKKLYVVNSTWRKNKIGKILKFNIENENFKLEKTITVDTNYPFSHLNTIFFKKNSILVCYHNYTEITRMPSQICELSKEWKFIKIVETSNLSCAHDCSIINNKLHVLDSAHGIFYMGKDKIHFKNRFLKGLDYDGQKYYLGVNHLAQRYNRQSMSPDLVLIDRKKKKKKFIKLYKTGNINNITVLK